SSSEAEFEEKAMVLCKGVNECLEDIERMKALINSTRDITSDILSRVTKMQKNTAATQVDEVRFDQIKGYVNAAYTLNACQEIKRTWDVESWQTKNEYDTAFAVFYPKYNNYMYV